MLAAVRVFSDAANKAEDWLPESFAETKQLEWFKEHFVADDLLAVSWEGCTIDDPNCEKLANLLNQPIDVGGGAASSANV